MNIRKKLMEKREVLMSIPREELVDLVMKLDKDNDIHIKASAIYKQRLSFYQNMHHKMNHLKPITEETELKEAYFHFRKKNK